MRLEDRHDRRAQSRRCSEVVIDEALRAQGQRRFDATRADATRPTPSRSAAVSVPVVPVRCCKLAVPIERDLACTTVPVPAEEAAILVTA